MIDKTHTLPVTKQCRLLGLNRSTAYYRPKATSAEADLALMRRIDRIHMRYPFLGSHRIPDELETDGLGTDNGRVNRKCVQRLMREMGIGRVPVLRRCIRSHEPRCQTRPTRSIPIA